MESVNDRFSWIVFGGVCALAPVFLFPRPSSNWIMLAVPVLLLMTGIRKGRILAATPLDISILLLLVMVTANAFLVTDIIQSGGKIAGAVYGVVLFYLIVDVLSNSNRFVPAIALFLTSGLMVGLLGILGRREMKETLFGSFENVLRGIPRFNFALQGAEMGINPNALGGALLLFIPAGLTALRLVRNARSDGRRWIPRLVIPLLVLILSVDALAIVISHSFGVSMAALLSVVIFGFRSHWIRRWILSGLFIAALAFLFLPLRPDHGGAPGFREALRKSASGRVEVWDAAVPLLKSHLVFGIGLNQFRRSGKIGYEQAHAHNQFLHTALELGTLGLVAYLGILIGILWMAGEVNRSRLPDWLREISRGLAGGQFGLVIFGLVDAIPIGAKVGVFFWISSAMITSVYLEGRKKGLLAGGEHV